MPNLFSRNAKPAGSCIGCEFNDIDASKIAGKDRNSVGEATSKEIRHSHRTEGRRSKGEDFIVQKPV